MFTVMPVHNASDSESVRVLKHSLIRGTKVKTRTRRERALNPTQIYHRSISPSEAPIPRAIESLRVPESSSQLATKIADQLCCSLVTLQQQYREVPHAAMVSTPVSIQNVTKLHSENAIDDSISVMNYDPVDARRRAKRCVQEDQDKRRCTRSDQTATADIQFALCSRDALYRLARMRVFSGLTQTLAKSYQVYKDMLNWLALEISQFCDFFEEQAVQFQQKAAEKAREELRVQVEEAVRRTRNAQEEKIAELQGETERCLKQVLEMEAQREKDLYELQSKDEKLKEKSDELRDCIQGRVLLMEKNRDLERQILQAHAQYMGDVPELKRRLDEKKSTLDALEIHFKDLLSERCTNFERIKRLETSHSNQQRQRQLLLDETKRLRLKLAEHEQRPRDLGLTLGSSPEKTFYTDALVSFSRSLARNRQLPPIVNEDVSPLAPQLKETCSTS